MRCAKQYTLAMLAQPVAVCRAFTRRRDCAACRRAELLSICFQTLSLDARTSKTSYHGPAVLLSGS